MRRVPEAVSSVDTAHAVDGDFLDEQFFKQGGVGVDNLAPCLGGFGRFEDGGVWCRCHGVSVPCDACPVRGLASKTQSGSTDEVCNDEGAQ